MTYPIHTVFMLTLVVLAATASVMLTGCSITPSDFAQPQPGVIVDHSPASPAPLLAERARIDDDRLIVQFRHLDETLLAAVNLSDLHDVSANGSSVSLYLQQAIQENNGLPVLQLARIDNPDKDGAAPAQNLPVTGIAMWREFRDRLIARVTPREMDRGIIIEFLKQDELFFYYDETGVLRSSRVNEKPVEFAIHETFRFSDLMSGATTLLGEYVPSVGETVRNGVLFNTGDTSNFGYPFVYANQDSGQIVFLRRPDAAEQCCDKPAMMLPQALVHTTDSHVTGLLKQPIGSIARLFTLVLVRVIDTLTPKPLVLLSHKPIQAIGEREPMDTATWEQKLDRLTHSEPSQGKMEYLVDGAQFFSRLIDTIQSARTSVDIRVYIFDNDHYALQIADLLKQRSEEIRVRVLLDGLGSYAAASTRSPHSSAQKGKLPSIIKYLQTDSDIELRMVDNLWLTGDHSKTILVDNRIAFIGGMNLGREYRYDWHDLMVQLQGPIVDEIQHQFEKAWRRQSYLGDIRSLFYRKRDPLNEPQADDVPIRMLLSRPGDSQILRTQLAAIAHSKQRIFIQNAYFTSDDILYELAKARRRGVDVRVIIPYRSDSGVINRSNVKAMNAMLANGIRVYIYPRESHIKGAIYDGWVCLGSANFDRLSLRVNRELNIATSHPQAAQEFLDRIIYPDLEKSVELTQPLPEKWSDFLMELIADQL